MNLMQLASMFRGQGTPQPSYGGAFGQPYDARMPDTTQVGAPYDAKMPDATQVGAPYDAKMPQPAIAQPSWNPLGAMSPNPDLMYTQGQGQPQQQQAPSLQNIYRNWLSGARGGLGRGLY